MGEPLKKIESGKNAVWVTQPSELDSLLKRRDIAFNIAKEKFEGSGGKIETVMQTAEAFGRGLYDEFLKKYSYTDDWTMQRWVEPVVDNVFNPMGTGATFTKISEDEAKSFIFKCPLHDNSDQQDMASLFTYGFLRGMLLSAFPKGEIIMGNSVSQGAPTIEFTFKATADDDDKFERERIKNNFGTTAEEI